MKLNDKMVVFCSNRKLAIEGLQARGYKAHEVRLLSASTGWRGYRGAEGPVYVQDFCLSREALVYLKMHGIILEYVGLYMEGIPNA